MKDQLLHHTIIKNCCSLNSYNSDICCDILILQVIRQDKVESQ